jgi:trimethylamine--corrinoid protein Co-methyltransferase
MQREYIYPAVGDRTSPKEWAEQGRTDIVDKAIKKVREILGSHFPAHVPEAVDAAIRRELPIRLARERMRGPEDRSQKTDAGMERGAAAAQ